MFVIAVLILIVVGYFVFQFWKYRTSDQGAPFVTIEAHLIDIILKTADVNENDILYDLGSGDGRIPIMAALRHKAKTVGIEIDRFRYYYSLYQRFLLRLGNKVTFLHKNIFDVNLSEATIVFMYLLQDTNEALVDKLLKELRPGTLVISGAFNFPGWKPVFVDREHQTPFGPISYYEIGKSEPGAKLVTNEQTQSQVETPPIK